MVEQRFCKAKAIGSNPLAGFSRTVPDLLVNQHSYNWGDEAAFLGLQSALTSRGYRIELILGNTHAIPEGGCIAASGIPFYPAKVKTRLERWLLSASLLHPALWCLSGMSSRLRALIRILKNSPLVVVAPGGNNLAYQDHLYLFVIAAALRQGSQVIFAGNSFGLSSSRRFNSTALQLLQRCRVVAREPESYRHLQQNAIPCWLSSDPALLLAKAESRAPTSSGNYSVFIPNQLWAWHGQFKGQIKRDQIRQIIETIIQSLSQHNRVVLLPQTFPYPNPAEDFSDYTKTFNCEVAEHLTPAEQITLIAGAQGVVSMRYHALVFAAIAGQRCFSLCYEQKMTGFHRTIYGQQGHVVLHARAIEPNGFQLPALIDFPTPKAHALSREIERLEQMYRELFASPPTHQDQTLSKSPRSISI